MAGAARKYPTNRSSARDRMLGRIRALGEQGLTRDWLVAFGHEIYRDWRATVDELVELGLVERRRVERPGSRWGLAGRPAEVVVYVAIRNRP